MVVLPAPVVRARQPILFATISWQMELAQREQSFASPTPRLRPRPLPLTCAQTLPIMVKWIVDVPSIPPFALELTCMSLLSGFLVNTASSA